MITELGVYEGHRLLTALGTARDWELTELRSRVIRELHTAPRLVLDVRGVITGSDVSHDSPSNHLAHVIIACDRRAHLLGAELRVVADVDLARALATFAVDRLPTCFPSCEAALSATGTTTVPEDLSLSGGG